jgi:hypothetical protein
MTQTARKRTKREQSMFYRRVETKLGIVPLHSDRDLECLVAGGLLSVPWNRFQAVPRQYSIRLKYRALLAFPNG